MNSQVDLYIHTPTLIMKREALCGSSDRGPTNVTFFWKLELTKIKYSQQLCRQTVDALTQLNPHLQTSFIVKGSFVRWIKLEPAHVPITDYELDDPDGWKDFVESELRRPFDNFHVPAWRVGAGTIRGEEKTALFALTFFHALGDGICFGTLAVQFNEILARIALNMSLPESKEEKIFPLTTLYEKYPLTLTVDAPAHVQLPFYPVHRDFAIHCFNKEPLLLQRLQVLCKENGIKIHGAFAASQVLAIREIVTPFPFETLEVLSAVSFRNDLEVPNHSLQPLFTWLAVNLDPAKAFIEIAKKIHFSLHAQMEEGKHIETLRNSELQLSRDPTPNELLSQIQFAHHLVNVVNRGVLKTTEKFPEGSEDPVVHMKGIYGIGGNTPYFFFQDEGGKGFTVGVTTVNGIMYCSASSIEDKKIGLGEGKADQLLKKMEEILLKETGLT